MITILAKAREGTSKRFANSAELYDFKVEQVEGVSSSRRDNKLNFHSGCPA